MTGRLEHDDLCFGVIKVEEIRGQPSFEVVQTFKERLIRLLGFSRHINLAVVCIHVVMYGMFPENGAQWENVKTEKEGGQNGTLRDPPRKRSSVALNQIIYNTLCPVK